mmetsp:Transcript_46481/g.140815  ORF Transcript_46481/g.140815 Transcript_46481/m.140815 type:complete len:495 (-) Transcript_46481:142-1626(-)
MKKVARLGIFLFIGLYAVSIIVTLLKIEQHPASGGPRFHLAGLPVRSRPRPSEASNLKDNRSPMEEISRLRDSGAHGHPRDIQKVYGTVPLVLPAHHERPGRFPLRGTAAFSGECGWTLARPKPLPGGNCTLLVRPSEGGNEGISQWSMQVVNGYLQARQSGCRLLIDYGVGVDVQLVMQPLTDQAQGSGLEEGLYDWSVPANFQCEEKNRCYTHGRRVSMAGGGLDSRPLFSAPRYRFAYMSKPDSKGNCPNCLYPNSSKNLQEALPGYRLESGMACIFANLFRPAPTAVEFEPRLFTEILPAMHDPESLVISIYLRTGWADDAAKYEEEIRKNKKNSTEEEPTERDYRKGMISIMKCAMNVEDHFKEKIQSGDMPPYSRVVWIILTDSPSLKKWAFEPDTSRKLGKSRYHDVNRTLLVTSSRGVHTRTRRSPSTTDFAEALLDWYLIGEADAVVLNRLTFGYTAALRSSRDVFTNMDSCAKPETLVYDKPTI